MDILIITGLIVAAILFLLIELFLIQGTSIAGFISLLCGAAAVWYAFTYIGVFMGIITLVVALSACGIAIYYFMRSKTLDKISLKKNITSKVDKSAEESVHVGDTGTTITRLALIGQAEIGGKVVEVKSVSGFLDEHTPVVVSRISEGMILVEKQN
ncbi:MAG: NfeD family protein [Bacteroides sp.]|nr:NfeD family protein [Bacteroides sp.]